MRIATWNVNGLRARLDFVVHWLKARQPDLVGLQELKIEDAKFPYDRFQELGYESLAFGQKGWNGVAILSRKPGRILQSGLPGQEDFGARLLTAEFAGLTFTNIYVPNGKSVEHDDYPRKLHWLEALTEHLSARYTAEQDHVIGGDFNICPEPIDSWDEDLLQGTIFHTDAERLRFAKLIDVGFEDLFRDFHPKERKFSWWDYRGGAFHRGQGLRIDLLLGTESVRRRVQAIEIDRDYRKKQEGLTASDHAPVFADLE